MEVDSAAAPAPVAVVPAEVVAAPATDPVPEKAPKSDPPSEAATPTPAADATPAEKVVTPIIPAVPPPAPTVGSTEFERFKALVTANSMDFTSWVGYLDQAEKESTYTLGAKAFTDFLALFPLCYGYWQKYADYTMKLCSADPDVQSNVTAIYEKAVHGIGQSVDMWMHYINFLQQSKADGAALLKVFERAVSKCGTDRHSQPLWNAFLHFQQTQENGEAKVCALYHRITTLVWQGATEYWQLYQHVLGQCAVASIASAEELAAIKIELTPVAAPAPVPAPAPTADPAVPADATAEDSTATAAAAAPAAADATAAATRPLPRMQPRQQTPQWTRTLRQPKPPLQQKSPLQPKPPL